MKSLAINPTGNSFIRENGKFRYTRNNLEYLAQKVRSVISIILGEWFLDPSLGIPYIPTSDNKIEHRPLLEITLRTKITAIQGIKKITSFLSDLDRATRKFNVAIIAETDEGELLELKEMLDILIPGGKG
jgi:CRISPR/Cas system CSM-associated protein Csm3 (group 7 of RAMP superfamily)